MVLSRSGLPRGGESSALAELVSGLPPVLAMGVIRAVRGFGAPSADARVDAAVISRELTGVGSGSSGSTAIDVDLPFVVTGWSARFYSDAGADDSTMVKHALTQTNGSGYLLGDSQGGLSMSLSAELDAWVPLAIPWLMLPREILSWSVTGGAGMVGTATCVLGLSGAYLRGFRAGAGR